MVMTVEKISNKRFIFLLFLNFIFWNLSGCIRSYNHNFYIIVEDTEIIKNYEDVKLNMTIFGDSTEIGYCMIYCKSYIGYPYNLGITIQTNNEKYEKLVIEEIKMGYMNKNTIRVSGKQTDISKIDSLLYPDGFNYRSNIVWNDIQPKKYKNSDYIDVQVIGYVQSKDIKNNFIINNKFQFVKHEPRIEIGPVN